MNRNFVRVKKCRICHSAKLYKFLDLGKQPIPNGFRKKKDLGKIEHKYELACFYCEKCGLVQLTGVVNPVIMFKNYLYAASTTKMMMNNFSSLAHEAYMSKKLNESSFVVDIGSNDGSLLTFFKSYDCKVVGVDPAENIAPLAELNGVQTEIAYFNQATAKKVREKHGLADVICATNVVAHTNDLQGLFRGIDNLLKEDGIFITEFPYLPDLLDNLEFDTIYHEHLSYFALKPWKYLVEKNGYEICDVRRLPILGGSIRLTHRRKSNKRNPSRRTVDYLLNIEDQKQLYDKNTYDLFAYKVNNLKVEFIELIDSLKKDGKKIAGYGAAAKASVLTNFFSIGRNKIDFIVDGTPFKQGLYTPGMNIPVYAEGHLQKIMPDYTIIFAWNFVNEILEKQKVYLTHGGKFVIPLPEIKII